MHGRTRWLSAAVVVLVVAAVPAVALGQGGRHSSKGNPVQGEYRGKTQQGYRAVFDVVNTRKGYIVQIVEMEIDATCGNETVGFFIGGLPLPIQSDGTVHRKFFDPFFGSFEIQGKVLKDSASGTASIAVPILNKDGTAKACASGDVGWKGGAPPAGGAAGTTTSHAAYRVHVTQSSTGRIVWSRG
jgi:hypothetical protein